MKPLQHGGREGTEGIGGPARLTAELIAAVSPAPNPPATPFLRVEKFRLTYEHHARLVWRVKSYTGKHEMHLFHDFNKNCGRPLFFARGGMSNAELAD